MSTKSFFKLIYYYALSRAKSELPKFLFTPIDIKRIEYLYADDSTSFRVCSFVKCMNDFEQEML